MTWAGTLGSAAAALAALAGLDQFACDARQAAVARYSRIGFEAAAATGMGLYGSGIPRTRPGVVRTAELRFGQPYAVVAVIADQDHHARQYPPVFTPWRGLLVFSAWITQPEDAVPSPAETRWWHKGPRAHRLTRNSPITGQIDLFRAPEQITIVNAAHDPNGGSRLLPDRSPSPASAYRIVGGSDRRPTAGGPPDRDVPADARYRAAPAMQAAAI